MRGWSYKTSCIFTYCISLCETRRGWKFGLTPLPSANGELCLNKFDSSPSYCYNSYTVTMFDGQHRTYRCCLPLKNPCRSVPHGTIKIPSCSMNKSVERRTKFYTPSPVMALDISIWVKFSLKGQNNMQSINHKNETKRVTVLDIMVIFQPQRDIFIPSLA